MIFFKKNSKKILITTSFLLVFLFCNIANANTFTDSISNIFNFINKNIIKQIKKDFCHNYISAISKGEWKEGEFRTSLGKKNCASFNISDTTITTTATTTNKIIQTILKPNKNSVISIKKTSSKLSINNPIPNIYIPNANVSGANLDIEQIISLTNEERKNNNSSLINLKENNILKKVAIIRVQDMFAYQYFEHNSPAGDNASKEAVKNNYTYITIGENIALGNFDGDKGLVTSWMNSPGHKANILNKNYTEIGVYAEQDIYKGQNVWIIAQIFGRPSSDCSEPEKISKDKITQYKIEADNMLTDIKNMDEKLKIMNITDAQTYNLEVAKRNTLAEFYNNLILEIKNLVTEYNKKIEIFNLCIKII